LETRGELVGGPGSRNEEPALLEGLSKAFQRGSCELREFVEEEHASVREADLARPGKGSPAHQ
jgi:hypothetical protein